MACKYAPENLEFLRHKANTLSNNETPESDVNGFWNFVFLLYFTVDVPRFTYAIKPELKIKEWGTPDLLVTRQIVDVQERFVAWHPWVIVYEGKRAAAAGWLTVGESFV